jgi:hypothetical protein
LLTIEKDNKKFLYTFYFKTAMLEKGEDFSSLNIKPFSKLTESVQKKDDRPIEIKVGMTIEEVEKLLGKPKAKAVVGNKVKYKYDDWKITFEDGKIIEIDF